MHFFHIDISRTGLRFCCALLVFILPLLVGGGVEYQSVMRQQEHDSGAAANKSLKLFEAMMERAEQANAVVLPLVGEPCQKLEFALREQVLVVHFVRSVNLAQGGVLYCTSLQGTVHDPDDGGQYISRKLLLMPGNLIRANRPLLVVRSEQGQDAALSAIDGEYLSFLLTLNDHAGDLFLRVGDAWLDKNGRYLEKSPYLHTMPRTALTSQRYPFSIYAGYVTPFHWRELWAERSLTLSLLCGISFCFSLLVWRLLGRPRSMEGELNRALQAREFIPYLQPLAASKSGKVIGAEVLMRWQHPASGLIRPDLFIPQAEECGLIVPMTTLLMQTVAQQLAAEQDRLPDGFHISFNISAAHCRESGLLAECRAFLDHFTPGKVVLVLELTERELLVADPHTLSLFKQLDEMGVKLAIDDFGTGHSSLVYLQQFHVDYLKIDQSFIGRIGTESLSQHIVDNVIDLGARLGLSLVAEGVETEQQAAYLQDKGVDYLQGYLFSRPVPLSAFLDLLP